MGNFSIRWYVEVTTYRALRVGLPMMALYTPGVSIIRKLFITVACVEWKVCDWLE